MEGTARTCVIRHLNDVLRRQARGGRIVATRGIVALGPRGVLEVLRQVQRFDGFSEDNDPYGEHDFGALTVGDVRVFWKIDYYAPDLMHASPDPADPRRTLRVLTIMRAEEY